jgi:catechol 1,2-dioxygenase
MAASRRREFLKAGGLGALGWVAGLSAGATATPVCGDPDDDPKGSRATPSTTPGPFYRGGAPFRGKLTPPFASGTLLVVYGQVFGLGSRAPLSEARLDVWQADEGGRYDMSDASAERREGYDYRARLMPDERGAYEFETIHPGAYRAGSGWRASHIHYRVEAPGHRSVVTQLFFEGDPRNAGDSQVIPELVRPVERVKVGQRSYELVRFDVVLTPLESRRRRSF